MYHDPMDQEFGQGTEDWLDKNFQNGLFLAFPALLLGRPKEVGRLEQFSQGHMETPVFTVGWLP